MTATQTDIPNTIPQPATFIGPPMEDPSTHLLNRVTNRWNDLLRLMHSGNFYIELLLIALALGLAYVSAKWLQQKIRNRIAACPPKSIDAVFITKPLLLLGPVMALLSLWLAQMAVIAVGIGGDFTGGIIQLAYSYLLLKCVLLVVHARPVAYFMVCAIVIDATLHAARINRSVMAYFDSIAFDAGKYHITAMHLLHGFVIFVVVFWGAGILSSTLESYLRRSTKLSYNGRELAVKFFRIFLYLIAFMITLSAMGIDLTVFAVFSGALGVGVGLGLQKLTGNFVSGVTMLMEKSIKIGDLIEVGGNTGWVRQLNIRYALIETFDGREILIPNEELISTRVINWTLTTTMGRVEIKIAINFDSDPKKAQALMLAAAQEHNLCLKDPPASCVLQDITTNGINFTLTFWIADVKNGRSGPQSDVQFAILRKFKENGIGLAKVAGA